MSAARRFLERLERPPFGFWLGALSFYGVCVLRGLLEGSLEEARSLWVQHYHWQSLLFVLVHLPLFFVASILGIALALSLASGEKPSRALKAALPFSPVILIPPLVDAFLLGGGENLSYMGAARQAWELLLHTFNFAHPIPGVTLGMRVEVLLIHLGIFLYPVVKGRGLWRGLGAAAGFYLFLTIILGGLPGIINSLWPGTFSGGGLLLLDTQKYSLLQAFLVIALAGALLGLENSKLLKALFVGLRPVKAPFYLVMALVGFGVGWVLFGGAYPRLWANPFDLLGVLGLLLAVLFLYWAAVLINDLFDYEIDLANAKKTSLVSGLVKPGEARVLAGALALAGGVLSASLGLSVLYIYLAAAALVLWYSAPPFRLKRVPILATFNLALVAIAFSLMGFALFAKEKALVAFPGELLGAFALGITFSFNLKDRTDAEGDRRGGVATLFTLLPHKVALWLSASLAAASFAAIPLVLGVPKALLVALPAAGGMLFLGVWRTYREGFMWLLTGLYAVGVGAFYYPKLAGRRFPEDVVKYREKLSGEQFYFFKEFDRAAQHYSRASLDPLNRARYAKALARAKRYREAEKAYEELLEENPWFRQALPGALRTFYTLEEPEKVLRFSQKALEFGAFSPAVPRFAGLAWLWLGEKSKALRAFGAGARAGDFPSLLLLGLAKPSFELRERALKLGADPEEAYPLYIYYLVKRAKDIPKARRLAREFLAASPRSPLAQALYSRLR